MSARYSWLHNVINMYIPKHFEQNDRLKSIEFMRAYNFAILVSAKDGVPLATHIPFVIEVREKDIVLVSHLSKANDQWKNFSDKEVLVIFSEPHAYISPSLYEKPQNVPTWNYVAVHAYGKIALVMGLEKNVAVLEKMIVAFDPSYLEQWKTLSIKYKEELLKGIVSFEINVTNLQGKEKLSQNKSETDRLNVQKHLEESGDELKQSLAKIMKAR